METVPKVLAKRKSPTEAECYLYGDIGGPFSDGITPEKFRAAIDDLGEFKALTMYVNSPGGSVFDGKAIVAQLERVRERAKVTAVVDGIAASAASFIAISADEVVMHPSARMMIHQPHAIAAGNADDFRKMADLLESESDSLVEMYRKKCGLKAEQIREMLSAETWMDAKDAVAKGFADRIHEPPPLRNAAEPTVFESLVAKTQSMTRGDEVKRRAALSRAQRVVETMRASSSRNAQ